MKDPGYPEDQCKSGSGASIFGIQRPIGAISVRASISDLIDLPIRLDRQADAKYHKEGDDVGGSNKGNRTPEEDSPLAHKGGEHLQV